MDITALSTAMSACSLQNDVSIAVFSKQLDSLEEAGEGLVNMIDKSTLEQSVNPHLGSNIDVLV